MRVYGEQPAEGKKESTVLDILEEVIKDELPSCPVNAWFIDSLHFYNMLDKIVERLKEYPEY